MAASRAETGAASADIVLSFLVVLSGRPLKIKTGPLDLTEAAKPVMFGILLEILVLNLCLSSHW